MPDQVQPQPVPTVWGFDATEEGSHVVIVPQTPIGTFVHFVEYENIDKWVEALKAQKAVCEQRRGGAVQSNIVVPGNVVLGPDGNPLSFVPPSADVQEHLNKINSEQAIDTTAREVEGETGDSESD